MKLNCPKCGGEISAENINMPHMAAKCSNCDSVFNFAAQFPKQLLMPPKNTVSKPTDINVQNKGGILTLQWRFNKILGIALIIVGLVVAGFPLTISYGDFVSLDLVLCLPGGFGFVIVYLGMVSYVNSITITITDQKLALRRGPLPSFGNMELSAKNIAQLYVKESRYRYLVSYAVLALLQDGTSRMLVWELPYQKALYIEQQIEHHLGIIDQPVRGEYGR